MLITAGADANARGHNGNTPLHYFIAVRNGNPAIIEALRAAGANFDARNDDGNTALDLAERNGNTGAIRALRATASTNT